MKRMLPAVHILIFLLPGIFAQESGTNNRILIAYFTWAQNKDLSGDVDTSTHASVQLHEGKYKGDAEIVAEWIQMETGGDLFEIRTAGKYAKGFNEAVEEGGREQRQNARPEFIGSVSELDRYEIVFLGYPVWWRDIPMVLYSFLERYNLAGKTVIPFATHMGGGLGYSIKTLEKLEPDADFLEPCVVPDYRLME